MKQIEYEERVMISKSDYEEVIDDLIKEQKELKRLHIVNEYLDNATSFIIRTKKMLRIRTTDDKDVELTLKIKNHDGSNIEINETLDRHPLIDKELEGQFEDYHPIAKLVTNRIETKYEDYILVIDENIYHGKTDYDLEVESKNQQIAMQILNIYCKKYNLHYDLKYQNKVQRAVQQANKKRDEN